MYPKNLNMFHTLCRTGRAFGQHWQSMIGLSICCLFIFSIESRAYGFYIDAIENTTFHESSSLPTPQLEQVSNDTLLVGLSPGLTFQAVEKFLHNYGPTDATVEKFWPEFNIALIRIPELSDSSVMASSTNAMQRLEEYRTQLEQIPSVRYADYNGLISVPLTPSPLSKNDSDESHRMDTQLNAINGWGINSQKIGDQEVVVAVIDSGYDTTDKDPSSYSLWENQAEINGVTGVDDDENGYIDDIHGWNWIDDNSVIDDPLGHGTVVIDTLLNAVTDLGKDRHSVKIQSLRILASDGKGQIANLIDALAYAVRTGTPIVNISLNSYYNAPALEEAIKIVYGQGVLMFTSIGHLCADQFYPAEYSETFAIVSVDWAMGACTTAIADIAIPDDDPDALLFNSVAPAHVIAVTTQMLLQHPEWSRSTIKSVLLSTADYILDDSSLNASLRIDLGILNAEATLDPGLIFDPPVLDFGAILTGTQKAVSFQVTNVATQTETYQLDADLPTTSCLVDRSNEVLSFDKQSFTLEPNASTTIEATFDSSNQDLGSHINLITMVSQHHNLDIPAWGQVSVDNAPFSYEFGMVADIQIENNTSVAQVDQTVVYTISLFNQDINSLQNVLLEGQVPHQTIFVPEQSSPLWEEQDGNLKLIVENISLDDSLHFNLAVQVDQDKLDPIPDEVNDIAYISPPEFTAQISDCVLSSARQEDGSGTTIVRDLSKPYGPTEEPPGALGTSSHTIYLPIVTR